jgi:hypothetical protein
MMIRKIMSLALMAVLIFPPLAVAADPPDLKGCWIGKTHSSSGEETEEPIGPRGGATRDETVNGEAALKAQIGGGLGR